MTHFQLIDPHFCEIPPNWHGFDIPIVDIHIGPWNSNTFGVFSPRICPSPGITTSPTQSTPAGTPFRQLQSLCWNTHFYPKLDGQEQI